MSRFWKIITAVLLPICVILRFVDEGLADILLATKGHGAERNSGAKAVVTKNVLGEFGQESRINVMADNSARMTHAIG